MAQDLTSAEKAKLDADKFLDALERFRQNQELREMNGNKCGNWQMRHLNYYGRQQIKSFQQAGNERKRRAQ